MAARTSERVVESGLVATYNAAGSDTFAAGDRVFIHVKNADASPTTVTVVTPGTVRGLAVADLAVVVAAGTEQFIGPLPAAVYGDSDQQASVSFSNTTSVTYAILVI